MLFYDLEWNDPQWGERQLELASRVQVMRLEIYLVTMVTDGITGQLLVDGRL